MNEMKRIEGLSAVMDSELEADSPNEAESRERATIAAARLIKNHDKTIALACDGKWEPFKPSG